MNTYKFIEQENVMLRRLLVEKINELDIANKEIVRLKIELAKSETLRKSYTSKVVESILNF